MKKNVEKMVDELKKTAGEADDDSEQKLVDDQKKTVAGEESQKTANEKLKSSEDEAIDEKQQVKEEDHKQTAKEAEVPKTKVITQIESSESLDKTENKTDKQCKKCMETRNLVLKRMKILKSEIRNFLKLKKFSKINAKKCFKMKMF
ncbi:hypothetical protein Hanom_Chr05g00399831 [Helianthus anomalus]